MASLTIQDIPADIEERLRAQATEHGHSVEAEARRIIETALGRSAAGPEGNLYERIRARFEPLGGVDLELPTRGKVRELPQFD